MPIFQGDVQTKMGPVYVSNIYHLSTTTITAAHALVKEIAQVQAATFPAFWSIDSVRTSTPAPDDGVFISETVSYPGTRTPTGQQLPFFNRFRVEFACNVGRPGVKFLVGPAEGDVNGSDFENATIAEFAEIYVGALFEIEGLTLCKPDGTTFQSGALQRAVGMRQLRRGSKRTSPVI